MKKLKLALLPAIIFSLLAVFAVAAQTAQLSLKLVRDWGYGGFNSDIEGLFSLRVTGPSDLVSVVYYIDDASLGSVDSAPFNLQFTTDNYSLGVHSLYAVGHSASGHELRSNIISANFVPKQSSAKIILPVLGVIVLAILLSTFVPFLASRRNHTITPLGAEREYGLGGGGICPNCHRPFPLPFLSAHFGASKIAVCPYCGKWNLMRVVSIDTLREAEKMELDWGKNQTPAGIQGDDKLRKELDDSKYQDL